MKKFPIFLLAGRDKERREIMEVFDPEKKYKSKCQLELLGKPVIQWVIDELEKSQFIDQIYVLGLTKEDLKLEGALEYIPVDYDSEVFDKIKTGFEYLKSKGKFNEMAVMCSADIPAVTVKSIDYFLKITSEKQHLDFLWGLVPIELAEAEFGDNHGRTVGRLKDYSLFPGDMFALNYNAIVIGEKTIRNLSDNRRKRSFWSAAFLVARRPRTWRHLIKFLLKIGTTKDGIKLFEKAFKCKADIVIVEELGYGYDMDLLVDYERLRKYVAKTKNIPLDS